MGTRDVASLSRQIILLSLVGCQLLDGAEAMSQFRLESESTLRVLAQKTAPLAVSRIGIGKICLGSSAVEVRRVMGRPQTIKSETTGCCGTLRSWVYPGLTVNLVEGDRPRQYYVYEFSTTNPAFSTPDGVRVGDTRGKVLKVYGSPNSLGQATTLSYRSQDEASTLTFWFEGQRVKKITGASLLN